MSRRAKPVLETWRASSIGWEWRVVKKYQKDDAAPYARWRCVVTSPLCPEGEEGDVYVREVLRMGAARVQP